MALLVAVAAMVAQRAQALNDARHVALEAKTAIYVSDLIHELQRERGMSAVFLGSKGTRMGAEMGAQRAATDKLRATLNEHFDRLIAAALHEELIGATRTALAAMASLDAKRKEIDSLAIAAPQSSAYFTETIGHFIWVTTEMAKEVDDPEAVVRLSSFIALMNAKERAGQERAIGAGAFSTGRFDIAQFRAFLTAISSQAAYIATFRAYANDEGRAHFEKVVTGPAVDAVVRMREIALGAGADKDVSAVDAEAWFKATTGRIDLLKEAVNFVAQELADLAERDIAAAVRGLSITAAIVAVALVVSCLIGLRIARGVSRPITDIEVAMGKLAAGEKATEIPGLDRADEIGAMAKAVQVFKDNALEMERMEAARREDERKRAEEATERQKSAEARAKKVGTIASGFESSIGGVLQAAGAALEQLNATSREMSSLADKTSQKSTAVAAASEQATANVQTAAAAAEELSSSIAEINRQVAQSSTVALKAVEKARNTNATVKALADAAQRVGEVVNLINSIASQTNLLALNATIEAARAGDAGKGFAVVASEVKALANQTAKATEEISSQIAGIQGETETAVRAIEDIGTTIEEISQISTAIASAVEEQGAATGEIARNVQQAATGTKEVSANIAGVSQASGAVGKSAGEVMNAADSMAEQTKTLKSEVERFLADMRAA
jgi:methyl-accepting chemotaxis protein